LTPFIILTCKGRLEHLKQSLPLMIEYTPAPIVVVDASCPDRAGDWVESLKNPRLHVERVEMPKWNLSLARNKGAQRALREGANYLIFLDADTLVKPEFWTYLEPRINNKVFLFVSPSRSDLVGILTVPSLIFTEVQGYDERFKEYGNEDLDLRIRLYLRSKIFDKIDPNTLSYIEHDNHLRVRFNSGIGSRREQASRTFRILSENYFRLTGQQLPAVSRNNSIRILLGR